MNAVVQPSPLEPVNQWRDLVTRYSEQYNLDPDRVLAMVAAESSGNPEAISPTGATGLLQITKPTARDPGLTINGRPMQGIGQDQMTDEELALKLRDPEFNVAVGTAYIAGLRDKFGDNWDDITAAYNGGMGRRDEYIRQGRPDPYQWYPEELTRKGYDPQKRDFQETPNHVRKVNEFYEQLAMDKQRGPSITPPSVTPSVIETAARQPSAEQLALAEMATPPEQPDTPVFNAAVAQVAPQALMDPATTGHPPMPGFGAAPNLPAPMPGRPPVDSEVTTTAMQPDVQSLLDPQSPDFALPPTLARPIPEMPVVDEGTMTRPDILGTGMGDETLARAAIFNDIADALGPQTGLDRQVRTQGAPLLPDATTVDTNPARTFPGPAQPVDRMSPSATEVEETLTQAIRPIVESLMPLGDESLGRGAAFSDVIDSTDPTFDLSRQVRTQGAPRQPTDITRQSAVTQGAPPLPESSTRPYVEDEGLMGSPAAAAGAQRTREWVFDPRLPAGLFTSENAPVVEDLDKGPEAKQVEGPGGWAEFLDEAKWFGGEVVAGLADMAGGIVDMSDFLAYGEDNLGPTDKLAAFLRGSAESIRSSASADWIQAGRGQKWFVEDADGRTVLNPNASITRDVIGTLAGSIGPGGGIGLLGKGILTAVRKAGSVSKAMNKLGNSRLGQAGSYGTANAMYIANDTYTSTFERGREMGLSVEEAEAAANKAGAMAGSLAFFTGSLGGAAFGLTGSAGRRIGVAAGLGALSEAPEEMGQYAAEQSSLGLEIDNAELAQRGILGAVAGGPVEGAIAGVMGNDPKAPVRQRALNIQRIRQERLDRENARRDPEAARRNADSGPDQSVPTEAEANRIEAGARARAAADGFPMPEPEPGTQGELPLRGGSMEPTTDTGTLEGTTRGGDPLSIPAGTIERSTVLGAASDPDVAGTDERQLQLDLTPRATVGQRTTPADNTTHGNRLAATLNRKAELVDGDLDAAYAAIRDGDMSLASIADAKKRRRIEEYTAYRALQERPIQRDTTGPREEGADTTLSTAGVDPELFNSLPPAAQKGFRRALRGTPYRNMRKAVQDVLNRVTVRGNPTRGQEVEGQDYVTVGDLRRASRKKGAPPTNSSEAFETFAEANLMKDIYARQGFPEGFVVMAPGSTVAKPRFLIAYGNVPTARNVRHPADAVFIAKQNTAYGKRKGLDQMRLLDPNRYEYRSRQEAHDALDNMSIGFAGEAMQLNNRWYIAGPPDTVGRGYETAPASSIRRTTARQAPGTRISQAPTPAQLPPDARYVDKAEGQMERMRRGDLSAAEQRAAYEEAGNVLLDPEATDAAKDVAGRVQGALEATGFNPPVDTPVDTPAEQPADTDTQLREEAAQDVPVPADAVRILQGRMENYYQRTVPRDEEIMEGDYPAWETIRQLDSNGDTVSPEQALQLFDALGDAVSHYQDRIKGLTPTRNDPGNPGRLRNTQKIIRELDSVRALFQTQSAAPGVPRAPEARQDAAALWVTNQMRKLSDGTISSDAEIESLVGKIDQRLAAGNLTTEQELMLRGVRDKAITEHSTPGKFDGEPVPADQPATATPSTLVPTQDEAPTQGEIPAQVLKDFDRMMDNFNVDPSTGRGAKVSTRVYPEAEATADPDGVGNEASVTAAHNAYIPTSVRDAASGDGPPVPPIESYDMPEGGESPRSMTLHTKENEFEKAYKDMAAAGSYSWTMLLHRIAAAAGMTKSQQIMNRNPDVKSMPFGELFRNSMNTFFQLTRMRLQHSGLRLEKIQEVINKVNENPTSLAMQTFHSVSRVENKRRKLKNTVHDRLLNMMNRDKITAEQLGEYMFYLHAPGRNHYLQNSRRQARADGVNVMPVDPQFEGKLSGISDAEAKAGKERMERKLGKAKLERLSKFFQTKMAARFREMLREDELVPRDVLAQWEPDPNFKPDLPMEQQPQEEFRDQVAYWEQMFRHTYVPIGDVQTDTIADTMMNNIDSRRRSGINTLADEVAEALGRPGGGVNKDAIGNMYWMMENEIVHAEQNKLYRLLGDMARDNPNSYLWTHLSPEEVNNQLISEANDGSPIGRDGLVVDETTGMVKAKTQAIDPFTNAKVRNDENMARAQLGTRAKQWQVNSRNNANNEDKRNSVFWYKGENGQPAVVVVRDAAVATALAHAHTSPSDMGAIMRAMNKASRMLSSTLTTYNPGFLPVNITRDFVTAKLQVSTARVYKEDPVIQKEIQKRLRKAMTATNVSRSTREYYRQLRNKGATGELGTYIEEFIEAGGNTAYFHNLDPLQIAAKMESDIKALSGGGTQNRGRKLVRWMRNAGELMDHMNSAGENGTRIVAARAAFEALQDPSIMGDQVMTREQAMERSVDIAKDLTVNFQRKGTEGVFLNSLYVFYNAGVQSAARFAQAYRDNPARMTTYMMGLMASSMALHALNEIVGGEDEDGVPFSQKVPPHVRNTMFYLMIPGTEGKYVSFPMPYIFNAAIATGGVIMDQFSDTLDDEQKKARAASLPGAIWSSISPIGGSSLASAAMPTMLQPFYDVMVTNRNYFNTPVNPERFPSRAPTPDAYNVRDPDNTGISGWVARALNNLTGGDDVKAGLIDVQPGTLAYMMEYYTGGVGAFASRTKDLLMYMGGADFSEKAPPVPIVRRFFNEVYEGNASTRYYELSSQIEYADKEIERAYSELSSGDLSSTSEEVARDHIDMYRTTGVLSAYKSANKQVRSLTTKRNRIRNQSNRTDAQNQMIKRYDDRIEQIQKRFNSFYFERVTRRDIQNLHDLGAK